MPICDICIFNLYVSLLQLRNIPREFRVVFREESKLEQRHPARPDQSHDVSGNSAKFVSPNKQR